MRSNLQYVPIPISRFLCGESAPMDLYLRLSEDKYIKVVRSGDYFNKDRLRNYREHKAETVFVTDTDFPKYVDGCLKLLHSLVTSVRQGVEQDFSLTFQVAETVFMNLQVHGVHSSTVKNIEELGEILSEQLGKKPKLTDFVEELFVIDNAVTRHSVATAAIVLMVLHGLRWKLKRNVDAIVMASLLHDYSLLKHPEIITEESKNWSEEATLAYENHPDEVADLLLQADVLEDKRVADIIRDHEELPDGEGFPRALTRQQIFPMALPLIMADRLSDLLMTKQDNFSRAVQYLKDREASHYPGNYWEALEKLKF